MGGQIITYFIGQCGNQLGQAAWELYCLEHCISPEGVFYEDSIPDSFSFQNFFLETRHHRFVPRTLLVDLEPSVIDEIKLGPYRCLFNPDGMINGCDDAANNFARGFYSGGRQIIKDVVRSTRRTVEACDEVEAFFIHHSYGGGTGSGFVSMALEYLSVEYSKKSKVQLGVFPSPTMSTSVVEPYNAVLGLHCPMENADVAAFFENEALFRLCEKNLLIDDPVFTHLNRMAAQVISGMTASLRFEGPINTNLVDFQTNLVPYPRIHFPIVSFAPFTSNTKSLHQTFSTREITIAANQKDNQMTNLDPNDGAHMSCCLLYRGDVNIREVNAVVGLMKQQPDIHWVDWCPTGYKVGINYQPMIAIPSSGMGFAPRALTYLVNSTAIKKIIGSINRKFMFMYDKKSFIHWYIAEGMEEEEFKEAFEDVLMLEKDYEVLEETAKGKKGPAGIPRSAAKKGPPTGVSKGPTTASRNITGTTASRNPTATSASRGPTTASKNPTTKTTSRNPTATSASRGPTATATSKSKVTTTTTTTTKSTEHETTTSETSNSSEEDEESEDSEDSSEESEDSEDSEESNSNVAKIKFQNQSMKNHKCISKAMFKPMIIKGIRNNLIPNDNHILTSINERFSNSSSLSDTISSHVDFNLPKQFFNIQPEIVKQENLRDFSQNTDDNKVHSENYNYELITKINKAIDYVNNNYSKLNSNKSTQYSNECINNKSSSITISNTKDNKQPISNSNSSKKSTSLSIEMNYGKNSMPNNNIFLNRTLMVNNLISETEITNTLSKSTTSFNDSLTRKSNNNSVDNFQSNISDNSKSTSSLWKSSLTLKLKQPLDFRLTPKSKSICDLTNKNKTQRSLSYYNIQDIENKKSLLSKFQNFNYNNKNLSTMLSAEKLEKYNKSSSEHLQQFLLSPSERGDKPIERRNNFNNITTDNDKRIYNSKKLIELFLKDRQ